MRPNDNRQSLNSCLWLHQCLNLIRVNFDAEPGSVWDEHTAVLKLDWFSFRMHGVVKRA